MLFNIFKGQYEGDVERVIEIYVRCMRMWRMNMTLIANKRNIIQDLRNDNIIKYPSYKKIHDNTD